MECWQVAGGYYWMKRRVIVWLVRGVSGEGSHNCSSVLVCWRANVLGALLLGIPGSRWWTCRWERCCTGAQRCLI